MHPARTERDFDQLSWHDNHLYGIHFSIGDASLGDWRSDLVLDIDHIVEWVCGTDGRTRFLVAPATLTFHDVTDLKIDIFWGDSGFRVALHEASIAGIGRSQVADQRICLDRPYFRWLIETNWPSEGKVVFGASGFTQVLRAEPILAEEQKLSPAARPAFQAR